MVVDISVPVWENTSSFFTGLVKFVAARGTNFFPVFYARGIYVAAVVYRLCSGSGY